MKKLLFLLLFSPFCLQAQQVSSMRILQNVKDQFPQAENIQMSGMNCGYYEATFFEKNEARSVRYDRTGEWMETRSLIEKSDLPATARQDFEENFASLEILEIIQKQRPEEIVLYEIRTEDGSRLNYSASGDRIFKNSCQMTKQ